MLRATDVPTANGHDPAFAGITVEQNTNFWIIRFTQTLDVNTRTFFLRHDGIVFESFLENMSVIIGAANTVDDGRI